VKGKLAVVDDAEGGRIAKMCKVCRKRKCKCQAQKSELRTIVPADRMRFRAPSPLVKAKRVAAVGDLARQLAKSAYGGSASGASPRWETPPVPDCADLYFQPESDKPNNLERAHQRNRRRGTAKRFHGLHGIHGDPSHREPELRYEPQDTLSQAVDTVDPHRIGAKKKPRLVAQKVMPRLKAGRTKTESMYGHDDGKEDAAGEGHIATYAELRAAGSEADKKRKKKRKKKRFLARRK